MLISSFVMVFDEFFDVGPSEPNRVSFLSCSFTFTFPTDAGDPALIGQLINIGPGDLEDLRNFAGSENFVDHLFDSASIA